MTTSIFGSMRLMNNLNIFCIAGFQLEIKAAKINANYARCHMPFMSALRRLEAGGSL